MKYTNKKGHSIFSDSLAFFSTDSSTRAREMKSTFLKFFFELTIPDLAMITLQNQKY